MRRPIAISDDFSAVQLRRIAHASNDARQVERLRAIANVIDGMERGEAAKRACITPQTLRDWVIRFNDDGPAGLKEGKRTGRKPKLTPEKQYKLSQIVKYEADPDMDDRVRLRLIDIKQLAREHFWADVSEMTVSRYLKNMELSYITARPQHPKQNPQDIEIFKKTLQND